jgi:hypothetical protein
LLNILWERPPASIIVAGTHSRKFLELTPLGLQPPAADAPEKQLDPVEAEQH